MGSTAGGSRKGDGRDAFLSSFTCCTSETQIDQPKLKHRFITVDAYTVPEPKTCMPLFPAVILFRRQKRTLGIMCTSNVGTADDKVWFYAVPKLGCQGLNTITHCVYTVSTCQSYLQCTSRLKVLIPVLLYLRKSINVVQAS